MGGSQGGAPGHQALTAPTFFPWGATSAPLMGRESAPSQRLLGQDRGPCRAASISPIQTLPCQQPGTFLWGARGRAEASVLSLMVPLIHCHACRFTVLSPMFTQKPFKNPRIPKRTLLSHFTDKEIGSERSSDKPGVTQQVRHWQHRGARTPDPPASSLLPLSPDGEGSEPTLGSAGW